jgi:hypothetical protein
MSYSKVTHNCSVFQQSHEMLVFYSQRHLLTVSSSQFSHLIEVGAEAQ